MRKQIALAIVVPAALLLLSCASMGWEGPSAVGRAEVDVSLFYDELAPYGDWSWVTPYGWVWSPRNMPSGWHPYTWGRWIASDLGWTWVSNWSWGWAPFHYGRWGRDPVLGWFWVPGRVWAPAWVAWRWGEGWAGWAPLPPDVTWQLGIGLQLDGLEVRLAREVDAWVFVEQRHFLLPHMRREIVAHHRNEALLRITRDVTRYEPRGGWPAELGLPPELVERELRRAVPRYRLEDLDAPPRRAERRPRGDAAGVYRPRVAPAPEGRSPRATRPPRHLPGGGE